MNKNIFRKFSFSGIIKVMFTIMITFSFILSQEFQTGEDKDLVSPQRARQRYITGEDGVARMYVNVWGHVNKPGTYLVYDGMDLVTLLSIAGGPKQGAGLSKIKLVREFPDDEGKFVHYIDFKKFISSGDRNVLVKVSPNDIYVISMKPSSYILSHVNLVNTFLSIMNLYYQIEYRRILTKK